MSEIRSGGASPSRAVLTVLRAAAVLIVATGLNDIIAGAIETYEPLYLYLGAVALATLLDGPLIGAVSAAIATFLYALVFGPRPPVIEESVGVPALAGALVVLVCGALGAGWRRLRRVRVVPESKQEPAAAPGETPLLEASIVTPAEEIVTALEEMRADLRGALAELSAARERERSLEQDLRAARTAAADDAARIVDGANRAIDALSARVQQIEEHSRAREARLEQAWAETREALGAQIRTLESELARERSRGDSVDRAEAEVVAARLEISELTNERDLARRELADLDAAIETLKRERDAAEATSARLAERIGELESELVEGDTSGSDQIIDLLQAERDAAQSTSAGLARRVAELESVLASRDDGQARIQALEAERDAARSASAGLAQRIAELERAGQEESRIGQATIQTLEAERDAARSASDGLAQRIAELERARQEESRIGQATIQALEAERDAARSASASLAQRIAELEAAFEAATDERNDDLIAARLESSQLAQRVTEVQAQLEEMTRERDALRLAAAAAQTEFDAKLQSIVSHLAEDHEQDLGNAIMEKEAARAETRNATQRLQQLQQKLDEEREKWRAQLAATDERNDDLVAARLESSQLAKRVTELEAKLDAMSASREELRAAAATAQAEFDAKLQSIVAHLAEDHEHDLGNAIMEKEAARAEARGMTQRLQQLQQKIDEERDKWLAQKQALTEKIAQAEARATRAVEDTTRVMSDARASWQAELERLRGRVAELEQRQARPAPIDLSAPIPMPPPPEPEPTHRPRIVVVHPDMELREAARSSLIRVGYDVATAADGLEGLRVAIAMKPDIVIADSQMPKMDGRELCQLLKSQEKTAHIKIVLLTRTSGERVDGADEVLKKPVPFEVLRTALSSLLAR